MDPILMIFVPIESWDSGLSIGTKLIKIGSMHRKLWRLRISIEKFPRIRGPFFFLRHPPSGGCFFKKANFPKFSKKRISQKFSDLRLHFELIITFGADVQCWWFLYRLKALSLSLQSVQKSSKFNICIKSYGDFEKSRRIRGPDFLKKAPPFGGGGA